MSERNSAPLVSSGTAQSHTYSKLSLRQCLGLGAGGIPDIGMQYGMSAMANPIFNVIYGVNPALIGIAFALPRLWEILIDPWIGALSDRTRGPLGRRHPYMIVGGILGFLTFALVWFIPKSMTPAMVGCWLIVFALAHFTAYSLFMVPYSALLGEVSTEPEQRMKAMSFRTSLVGIGSLLIGWLYWLCQMSCFSSPAEGMKFVGIGFGLLLLLGSVLPVFVCTKNRRYQPVMKSNREKLSGLAIIRELWNVKPFRGILLAVFCLLTSCLLVSNMNFYISLCFMFHGNTHAVAVLSGVIATVNSIAVILFCPVVNICAKKFGEKNTLYTFMGVAMLGWVLGFWAAHPAHPYWTVVTGILGNFGQTAFWIIMPALVGEIGRQHELSSGHSLYGSFYALYGMSIKIGSSLGLLFTGIILNLTGYQVSHGASQPQMTIFLMRFLSSAVPTIGMLLAMYCLYTSLKSSVLSHSTTQFS
jgi:glycoside/pentoside/hexuronide:cation symporter, GPH family